MATVLPPTSVSMPRWPMSTNEENSFMLKKWPTRSDSFSATAPA